MLPIVQSHHLIIMHWIHAIKVFLVLLVSTTTICHVSVVSVMLSCTFSTALSFKSLVLFEFIYSFRGSFSPLVSFFWEIPHNSNFLLIRRLIVLLLCLKSALWFHTFDIFIFQYLWASLDIVDTLSQLIAQVR